MKKTVLLAILVCFNYCLFGQSPITDFKTTITNNSCEHVGAEFTYIKTSSADCDSVLWDFGDGEKSQRL
jgi:hypothetical protein